MTPFFAQRFLNTPLLLEGRRAASMLEGLRAPRADYGDDEDREVYEVVKRADGRLYELVDGVAIVPVRGILVHGLAWGCFGETSYDDIRQMVGAAIIDEDATAIALHIDSPGGEVAGCWSCSDFIYSMRGKKPIISVLADCAYSAAYALASAADFITVPSSGGVGSIGVIAMRLDITGALAQMGIKVTTLVHGARKTDTYPTSELSEEAQKRLQADIDALGQQFVALVARNRGISEGSVRKMEAGTFLGAAGIESGLADRILEPEEARNLTSKIGSAQAVGKLMFKVQEKHQNCRDARFLADA